MKKNLVVFSALTFISAQAQVPDHLVVDGVPPIPNDLKAEVSQYLEFRSAVFQDWHPRQREVLITTRFADASQLHLVRMPGGTRRQLTFLPEPVAGGLFRPKSGELIVFSQDSGGGEFYQLFRYDVASGRINLLTDGKSRNTGVRWANGGRWLAYTSTRRNGRDSDIYVMDPGDPKTDRRLAQVSGGGWSVQDWSPDESRLLLLEYLSINESHLHLADAKTGEKTPLTRPAAEKVAFSQARFAPGANSIFVITDKDSEFRRLALLDLASGALTPLTGHIRWDVDDFDLSPDGRTIAFVTNEGGVSVLHLLNTRTGKEQPAPKLPTSVIGGVKWHENGRDLGFLLTAAQSPSDVYSADVKTGKLERWTESETGGLDASSFVQPELVRLKSFDGLSISAFVYRPDSRRFPGKRPVLINIHGGPEAQFRPIFQARNNYFLSELGVAMVFPNVRGSDGYGKTFLTLDNGFKRVDSVKDIGAIINWIKSDSRLDGGRVGVVGGSYGGYMVLACMEHYNDELRCGVDVVGISNFLTFLKNTQDYRRDLRRAEYGDEREEKMREFLEKISPTTNVKKIRKPLLVVQGKNDPRVPLTESEQMVKAIRDGGGKVWYLMATDEGHGFQKKKNQDYQFLATILFLREFLLDEK